MARIFTLEEAQALMPQVRTLTEPVYLLADSLAEELARAGESGDQVHAEEVRERLQTLVESWAESIRDLGADVKGLWLVDFDSGDGYWCWAHPEDRLEHWHSYEAGFAGRIPAGAKGEPGHGG